MKVRIALCLSVATLLVAAMGGRATAAGQPSQDSLAAMGLGGMTVMSDSDALAVRGMGYSSKKSSAKAWGKSYAQVASRGAQAGSENGYKSEGKYYATGKNLSYAGLLIVSSHGGGGGYGGGGGGGPAAQNSNGGGGGHPGGGGVKVKAVVVFAGGSSTAKAH